METEKKAGFDASKPFVVPILSGGEKTCEVRFPSDDEPKKSGCGLRLCRLESEGRTVYRWR